MISFNLLFGLAFFIFRDSYFLIKTDKINVFDFRQTLIENSIENTEVNIGLSIFHKTVDQ